MLTLKYITENTEDAIARLAKKHFDGRELLTKVIELDTARKTAQREQDELAAEMNKLSKIYNLESNPNKK